jgi:hypothetical protein
MSLMSKFTLGILGFLPCLPQSGVEDASEDLVDI